MNAEQTTETLGGAAVDSWLEGLLAVLWLGGGIVLWGGLLCLLGVMLGLAWFRFSRARGWLRVPATAPQFLCWLWAPVFMLGFGLAFGSAGVAGSCLNWSWEYLHERRVIEQAVTTICCGYSAGCICNYSCGALA
jgi:hypothetical protein